MDLAVFHHVPDVAGAEPQGLRRDDRGLSRDEGIADGQHQVPLLGFPEGDALGAAKLFRARMGEAVEPALVVRQEEQHQRRLRDEGLVVAGDREPVLEDLIFDLQDRIEHHVAPRGGPQSGTHDGVPLWA